MQAMLVKQVRACLNASQQSFAIASKLLQANASQCKQMQANAHCNSQQAANCIPAAKAS
jgi:hypothetical protein